MQSVVCITRASRLRACKVAPPSRPKFAGTTHSRWTCPTFPVRHGALMLGGYLLPRVVPRKAHRSPLRGSRKERTTHGLTAPIRWIGRKNKVAVVVTGTQKIDDHTAQFDPGAAKTIDVLYLTWIARRSFIRRDIGFIRPSLSRADVLAAGRPPQPRASWAIVNVPMHHRMSRTDHIEGASARRLPRAVQPLIKDSGGTSQCLKDASRDHSGREGDKFGNGRSGAASERSGLDEEQPKSSGHGKKLGSA